MINNGISLLSPKHCFLACYLLQIKSDENENSKWKIYYDSLPKNFKNFPIFFSKNEINYLEGSPFKMQIEEKLKDLKKDFNLISNISEDFQSKYSFTNFCEMRMMVSSRIFGIKIRGKKTDCLCPIADMLNHRRPRHTIWYFSDDLNSFVIQALEPIEANSEIFDSYGKKCNSRFFLNYGFVVEENESNEFPIEIELNDSLTNLEFKLQIIGLNNLKQVFRVQGVMESKADYYLLCSLRFILFSGSKDELLDVSDFK